LKLASLVVLVFEFQNEEGHVRPKHHLIRVTAQQIGHGGCAPAMVASVRWLVANAPCELALE